MNKTKICSKCGEEKPRTNQYFYKRKVNVDGLEGQCKDCATEYRNQYFKGNKERVTEIKKLYYKNNKAKTDEYQKQYRNEHKDKQAKYTKIYAEKNKEKIKKVKQQYVKNNSEYISEWHKQYSIDNKEELAKKAKKYYKNNPQVRRLANQKYKARKKELPCELTVKQWETIKDYFNNSCAYCGATEERHNNIYKEQLHQEHFIPLSKGGEYTLNNIIPSCRSCNCSKGNDDFFKWYPKKECYNIHREKLILKYLGYTNKIQQLSIL